MTVTGSASNNGSLTASGAGKLRFSGAVVTNAGHTITADGSIVELANSTITGGTLRATDDAASFMQFAGDVTLEGTAWEDPGAGIFRVYQATARLLGDYAHRLPAGYTLVVDAGPWGSAQDARLTVPAGTFTNDGLIELRGSVWAFNFSAPRTAQLYLEGPVALAGAGQVVLATTDSRYDVAQFTGAVAATLTVGPGQSIRGHGGFLVPVTVGPGQSIRGRGVFTRDLINEGLIEANVSGAAFIFCGAVTNSGTMRGTGGGSLDFNGDLHVDGAGRLDT